MRKNFSSVLLEVSKHALLIPLCFFLTSSYCLAAGNKPCLDNNDRWVEYLYDHDRSFQKRIEQLNDEFNINCKDKRGDTLLMAVSGYHRQYGDNTVRVGTAIPYLISQGADIFEKNRDGKQVWELEQHPQIRKQLKEIVALMEKHKTKNIGIAEKSENTEITEYLAKFRRDVSPGDDTSMGVVIEVKGKLVKIQTNDSQCSQRDYGGSCTNYINTPAEKWVKRVDIHPKK